MFTGRTINGLKVILVAAGLLAAAVFWLSPGSATVPTLDVSDIASGYYHTCGVTDPGGVECWGENEDGQLGIPIAESPDTCDTVEGIVECSVTPVDVTGLGSGVAAVTAGLEHTCALLASGGGVKCWGDNSYGQLGDGTTVLRDSPVDVCLVFILGTCHKLLAGVGAIAAGGDLSPGSHTCALMTAGGVKCWGSNIDGELGDGTTTNRTTPVDVCATGQTAPCTAFLSDVASIAAGGGHTCAVTSGGLKCWGENQLGQLGDGQSCGTICRTPVDVTGMSSDVAEVAAPGLSTCALSTGGGLKCWGYNLFGQLGDGTTTGRNTPVDVCATGAEYPCTAKDQNILTDVVKVVPGPTSYHTCAVTDAPVVLKCWGLNGDNQLGATSSDTCSLAFPCSKTPIDVSGLGGEPAAAATGGYHTCAIIDLVMTGEAQCWGQGEFGQLGDGTAKERANPVDVLVPDDDTDNDSDGCTDSQELGTNASGGGMRNPKFFWDFFDVPTGTPLARDERVDGFDILAVSARFGTTGDPSGDPLSTPPDTGYHTAYDRSRPPGSPPPTWYTYQADGRIEGFDIGFVSAQFGHSCAS